MNIFITGINGFLGRRLTTWFFREGFTIKGSVRSSESADDLPLATTDTFVLPLEGSVPPQLFKGIDLLIHAAHDPSPEAIRRNVEGTRKIIDAAERQGVGRQLFFSSYSAFPDAVSEYGRIKCELEEICRDSEIIIVRPGLVVGNGGLFGRMLGMIRSAPLLPLPNGGRDMIPLIGIADLATALIGIADSPDEFREYNLFYKTLYPLKELLIETRDHVGGRARFIHLPFMPLIFVARLLKSVGLRPPVSEESLLALRVNQSYSRVTDLPRFVNRPDPTIRQMLEQDQLQLDI